MIFASKITLNLNTLNILGRKVTKNLKNLPKKFCEFPPGFASAWQCKGPNKIRLFLHGPLYFTKKIATLAIQRL